MYRLKYLTVYLHSYGVYDSADSCSSTSVVVVPTNSYFLILNIEDMASTQNITVIGHCDQVRKANDPRNTRTSDLRVIEKTIRGNEVHNATKKNPTSKAYLTMKKCIDFIELFGAVLGWKCDFEWKSNPRYYFTLFNLFFTWAQYIYSQWRYVMSGEHNKILQVFAVYGIALSCTLGVRLFVCCLKNLAALHNFAFKVSRQSFGKYADKIEDEQLYNWKLIKFQSVMAFASGLIMVYYPIKSFIVDHELVALIPIQIMFIDQSDLFGFLAANAVMMVLGTFAITLSLYRGLQFFTLIMTYGMQVDLIEIDICQLDEFWGDTSTTSVAERHSFLRNICLKCQDKDNYINEVKKIFDRSIFGYFCVAYISQIICLYIIKAENWTPGYGLAFGLFFEMLFICYVGTRTSTINERLCYAITQSNWYTYDIHSQKIILLLLHSCMNAQELWIGPLAPLSVFTGTQMVKSIYSYYTVLMEVM